MQLIKLEIKKIKKKVAEESKTRDLFGKGFQSIPNIHIVVFSGETVTYAANLSALTGLNHESITFNH
jgi:hypothetical protein